MTAKITASGTLASEDRNFPLAVIQVPDYKGATEAHAPFVYRLGHQIFILGRGVRLP